MDDTAACGDATFAADPVWESTERAHATGLGWADTNGDGSSDLVVASGNDIAAEPVSVHLGRDGSLPAAAPDRTTAALGFHGHLAVADLDADGFDDVVVTRFLGEPEFAAPGGVDLYRGGPDGLVEPPAWSIDGLYTFGLALGDMDGDGDRDLALAVGEPYAHGPFRQVVYAGRDGAFGAAPAWTSDDEAHAVAVAWADVDGDADLDLVQARSGGPHVVYGNDGGLATSPTWEAAGDSFDGIAVVAADATGDGALDLLFTDNTYTGGPGVVRLYCGPLLDPCWQAGAGEMWSAAALFDVDGDGSDDVIAGQWWGPLTAWAGRDGVPGEASWRSAWEGVAEAFAIDADRLAVSDWDPERGTVIFERESSCSTER